MGGLTEKEKCALRAAHRAIGQILPPGDRETSTLAYARVGAALSGYMQGFEEGAFERSDARIQELTRIQTEYFHRGYLATTETPPVAS